MLVDFISHNVESTKLRAYTILAKFYVFFFCYIFLLKPEYVIYIFSMGLLVCL